MTDTSRPEWRTIHQETLPDGDAVVVRLPGVPTVGAAHTALFAAARAVGLGPVAVLGPGAAPSVVWAVRGGARVAHIADSAAEADAVSASLVGNHLPSVATRWDWEVDELPIHHCHLVLLHLPRGRDRQRDLLRLAGALLVPGGRLVFVGATNEGVRSAIKAAAKLLGSAGVVARKGGYHAAIAVRPAEAIPPPPVSFDDYPVVLDGEGATLITCTGVFARDRLDDGAAALISGMEVATGARVLDLGCGPGLVALAAARRGADVVATDVSARAVASARRTLNANNQPTITVHHCCGAAALDDASVDTVVTNPPFHTGHDISFEIAQLFVREARRVLVPGGSVYMVANRHLNYGQWLRPTFGRAEIAYENTRFRVWHAIA